MIYSGDKLRHILNLSKNAFYIGHKKNSYTAWQLIETEAVKIVKNIRRMMFGHSRERRVKIWALDVKGEKTLAYFWVDDLNLPPTQCNSFMVVIGKGTLERRFAQKGKRWDIEIHVRLIGS